jgi:hypothetical protein
MMVIFEELWYIRKVKPKKKAAECKSAARGFNIGDAFRVGSLRALFHTISGGLISLMALTNN